MSERHDHGPVNLTLLAVLIGIIVAGVWIWKRLSLDTQDYIIDQAVPMAAGARYTDDTMFLYLQSGTEWDSLAHVFYDGRLYNGFDASQVDSNGAHKVGIDKTCSSYVSRGVLLDVARFHGVECLDPRHRIDGD